MNKIGNVWIWLLALVVGLGAMSCDDKESGTPPFLEVETPTEGFSFLASVGTRRVVVKTSVEAWSAEAEASAQEWLSATRSGTSLQLSVAQNNDRGPREGRVTVKAGTLSESFTVVQMGQETAIVVDQLFTVSEDGEELVVTVSSNTEYELVVPASIDWVEELDGSNLRSGMVAKEHLLQIGWNPDADERRATIVLKQVDGDVESEFVILQKGQVGYGGESSGDIADDRKVKVAGGKASSFQPGSDIDKTYDDDMSTIYHSNWSNGGANYFPITLDYYFEGVDYIDYLVYHPRTEGWNGHFKETEIWVKTKGNELTKLMDFDFKGSSSATRITFDEPLLEPETVRFVVKSGAGDGQGFASCSEMEFYQVNEENMIPLDLFTDETVSELRPGVTLEDISKVKNKLYRNIAYYLFKGE